MYKNILKVVIILIIYAISLILFIAIFGVGQINNYADKLIESEANINIAYAFVPLLEAGVYHFFIMLSIAIFAKFNKKLNVVTKNTLYYLPLLTFIFTIPATIPSAMIAKFFGLI